MTASFIVKCLLGVPMVILVVVAIYQMIKSMNLGEKSMKPVKQAPSKQNKLPTGKVDKFN